MTARTPRVFSVPFGVEFLPRIADGLLDGELIEGFGKTADPLHLSSVTIYVPTRRSARELRSIFVERLQLNSAILPTVKPLGDIDEDAAMLDGTSLPLDLPPPIGQIERILKLAPLVRAWKSRLPAHVAEMFAEPIAVPVTEADAIWLARDIAALMDEVELEGADWNKLPELAGEDLAGWWQITLEFLQIVTSHWPEFLKQAQRMNPAAHRNARMDIETARLKEFGSKGPVIAAGSTGSIPATARLLSAISRLENGAVVLPGLDMTMDNESWRLLEKGQGDPSIFGHPQYGLRKLLMQIGVSRNGVVQLAGEGGKSAAGSRSKRVKILGEALRPAETTDQWAQGTSQIDDREIPVALDGISLVEAANERDEGLAIAVALRRAIDQGDRKTALVTNDRRLARRVSAELRRYGIIADDSAGRPLSSTMHGNLVRQIADCIFKPGDPVGLLVLFKNPLIRLALAEHEAAWMMSIVELILLRSGPVRPDARSLCALWKKQLVSLDQAQHQPIWFRRIDEEVFEKAGDCVRTFEAALSGLSALRSIKHASIPQLALETAKCLEALCIDEKGSLSNLYGTVEGEAIATFLRNLVSIGSASEVETKGWPQVLDALMAGHVVRPQVGADTRVAIWGPLEARLQSVDTVVLAGLNEGTWPASADADPFMSRFMKTALGLAPPERSTGLAAHDFYMAMGTPKVVITRSLRSGEEPSVPSRWLQRLLTFIGEEESEALRRRGQTLLDYKDHLDKVEDVPFAERPNPKPPLDFRPERFSVTEIETWRRDPYAIFAKRILRLEALEHPLANPDARERGTIIHEIFHRFLMAGINPSAPIAREKLDALAARIFSDAQLPDDVQTLWWRRYQITANEILGLESGLRLESEAQFSEIRAHPIEINNTGVFLSGFADRIVYRFDGSADILDFKTGSYPSRKQARTLIAPQLPIEAAMLKRGSFRDAGALDANDLAYVRVNSDGTVKRESILKDGKETIAASELSEDAWRRLIELVEAFRLPDQGYLSRSLPFRENDADGDYDHLARVLEWSAGAGSGEDAE